MRAAPAAQRPCGLRYRWVLDEGAQAEGGFAYPDAPHLARELTRMVAGYLGVRAPG